MISMKCAFLTGATQGIGRATAQGLCPLVDRLLLHGIESPDAVEPLLSDLRQHSPSTTVEYLQADYGRLDDVEQLARAVQGRLDGLDLLINNAGRPGPPSRTLSGDAHEITFQTNYLAPVALTKALLPLLERADRGRIINVASATHYSARLSLDNLELERDYSGVSAYAHSKLAVVTFTCWMARRLEGTSVEAVSLHPGVISTGLLHAMFGAGGSPVQRGAQNILRLASREPGLNGLYFDEGEPTRPNPDALDPDNQDRLVDATFRALSSVGGSPAVR